MRNKEYRDSFVAAHLSNTIAAQIHALRDGKGWTQKHLAQEIGTGQSRISALENPDNENVEIATLRRLASAFDVALTVRFVPYSELLGWAVNAQPEAYAVPDFDNDTTAKPPIRISEDASAERAIALSDFDAGTVSFSSGNIAATAVVVLSRSVAATTRQGDLNA